MYRGTTPTHTFNVDLDMRGMAIYITYSQKGLVVLEKSTKQEEIEVDKDYLRVHLTQEDTLAFSTKGKNNDVEIQIRCVDSEGNADCSEIIRTPIERILKDGEISYE